MSAPVQAWGELAHAREGIRRRWPSVFDLPVVRRRWPFLAGFLRPDSRVLEVGAAERPFDGRLREAFPAAVHRTLDIDPGGSHDYRSLDEVEGRYDLVLAWEVIEHLPLGEIPGWLAGLGKVTAPGGRLVVSTPNVFRPGQYWLDATHLTPLAYAELGGLVTLAGFEVASMHRTYHASALQYALRRGLAEPLHRLMGVDYARSVLAVATPR